MRTNRTSLIAVAILLALTPSCTAQPSGVCGDCNGDAVATITDALVAAQHSVGLVRLECPEINICNVTGDPIGTVFGGVYSIDALVIAQFVAGLPVSLVCATVAQCEVETPDPSWPVVITWRVVAGDDVPVSIQVDYSTNAGVTFSPATEGLIGDGTSMLETGCAPGTSHVYSWDTRADGIGTTVPQQARIRITLNPGSASAPCTTADFCVDNSLIAISGTWREIQPDPFIVPPARVGATMVYDSARHRMILFAGGQGILNGFNDVWSFDLTADRWTELFPTGALPPVRQDHAAIYDPIGNRMITYGGIGGSGGGPGPGPVFPHEDTWALDFSLSADGTWSDLMLGTASYFTLGVEAVYRSKAGDESMLMTSGVRFLPTYSTSVISTPAITAKLDLDTIGVGTWTEILPVATIPPAQFENAAVAYDRVADRVLSFGGRKPIDTPSFRRSHAGLWEVQLGAGGATWVAPPVCSGPAPRENTHFAFDSSRQRAVLFGGNVNAIFLSDTWLLQLPNLQWRDVTPVSALPLARSWQVFEFDPVGDRFILFGGRDQSGVLTTFLNDTWELRY